MSLKKILSFSFPVICLSGFIIQVQQVSDLYFRFGTTSKTILEIRESDEYQTIMYCPRSLELLNKTNKEFVKTQNLTLLVKQVEDEINNLTIKDILELTPPENNVIEQCVPRQGIMSIPRIMDGRDCEAFFNVSKSVIGERVCYTIMPQIGSNFSVGEVASSKHYTNTAYTIHVNRSILASKFAFFISWTVNEGQAHDPLDSRPYQAKVLNHKTLRQSSFSVFGESIKIYRLPPPYDTKCTPGHHREQCYELCLNEHLALINRVSWSSFHRKKLDLKIVTGNDLKNDSTFKFMNKVFFKCQSLCKTHADCFTQFSRTLIQEFQSSQGSYFSSMVPSFPHTLIYAVPFITLIEFVIQLGSSFGIWFGLSIISLNPMKMLQSTDSTSRLVNDRNKRLLFILSKLVRQNKMQNC